MNYIICLSFRHHISQLAIFEFGLEFYDDSEAKCKSFHVKVILFAHERKSIFIIKTMLESSLFSIMSFKAVMLLRHKSDWIINTAQLIKQGDGCRTASKW